MGALLIEQLTAHSTPNRLPVEGEDEREQWNWVVRLAADLPQGWDPEAESAMLSNAAASAVCDAHVARGLAIGNEHRRLPIVRLVVVDGRHVVVNITTIRLEADDTHAWLVAASAVLSAFDRSTPIEDLQGIPRRFWSLLIGK